MLEGFKKSWIQPEKQLFLKLFGMQQIQTLSDSIFLKDTSFFLSVKDQIMDCSSFGQVKRNR